MFFFLLTVPSTATTSESTPIQTTTLNATSTEEITMVPSTNHTTEPEGTSESSIAQKPSTSNSSTIIISGSTNKTNATETFTASLIVDQLTTQGNTTKYETSEKDPTSDQEKVVAIPISSENHE